MSSFFGSRRKRENSSPNRRPPNARDAQKQAASAQIRNMMRERQQAEAEAVENERRAVNAVAERERKMNQQISQLTLQLRDKDDEIVRLNRTGQDLQKALRLAAEKLSQATAQEQGARAELQDARLRLQDAQSDIQTLRARLYGEKGVILGKHGGPTAVRQDSASKHEDDVISAMIKGTVGGLDGKGQQEGRALASRFARQQLKRLLQFSKGQLSEELSECRSKQGEEAQEMFEGIGKRRGLIEKLESALYELMGGPPMALRTLPGGASGVGMGSGGGGAAAIGGWQPKVNGQSLPRSVAVDEAGTKPILLASGPATKWVVRPRDLLAPAAADNAAAAPTGTGEDGDPMPWVVGDTCVMAIEAVDEAGSVDIDYDGVVLLETEAHVTGRGLVRVTKGVGLVHLSAKKAGEVELNLQDGGFTAMEPPNPFLVNFVAGPPAKVGFKPEEPQAVAGDGVPVVVEIQDSFDNICEKVSCEVVLAATHGADFGEGPILIEEGTTTVELISERAATVGLSCLTVKATDFEISDAGLSTTAYVRYVPGQAQCVQISLPEGAAPIAGQRTKLLVTVADKNGNIVPTSALSADLVVEPGRIGNASVERNGAVHIADGTGEVRGA